MDRGIYAFEWAYAVLSTGWNAATCVQIGANRDFDPEIYRKQIRENRVSKVEGPRRAYVGAGNILCHPDGNAPHSSMAPPPSHASLGSANCTNDVFHSAYAADASSECP